MLNRSQAAAVAAAIKYGQTVSVLGNGTHHVRIGPMGNSADFRIVKADVDYVTMFFDEMEHLRNVNSSCSCSCLPDSSNAGTSDILCDDQQNTLSGDIDEQREHVSTEVVSDTGASINVPKLNSKRKPRKSSSQSGE